MTEFELIAHYFKRPVPADSGVALGIGDDAAICSVPPDQQLVITVDTLVAGVHFPLDTPPADLGHKALAVNLSDLAAMGAKPAWFTLALTCPQADLAWLAAFSEGLLTLAQAHQMPLIGGDTTRGPLSITIQAMGLVPPGLALTRGGAQAGDGIYVTGSLGDAGLGLQALLGYEVLPTALLWRLLARLHRPTPRIAAGLALRGLAHSAVDISDGLLADLGHILSASGLGASLQLPALPLSADLHNLLPSERAWTLALSAGDDYELCFTASPAQEPALAAALGDCPWTRIGTLETQPGIRCYDAQQQLWQSPRQGYQHFANDHSTPR